MAKFSFRLQPVLKLKAMREDNLKNELGKAIRKMEEEKQKLIRLNDESDTLSDEFNKKTKKAAVGKLIEYREYLSFLASKIRFQKERVNCAACNVDKIREELIIAVKEKKILDKLKEKKKDEYNIEEKKLEQKANDEIVSSKQKT